MKIERFKSVAIQIEALCDQEAILTRKQTTTTSGSNTWTRYQAQIIEARKEKIALWKEIEQALYGEKP